MGLILRIALGDAEADHVEFLSVLVEKLGHQVHSSSLSGRELIEKCGHDIPDLIVTSACLHDLDGIDASTEICRKHPVPVIMLSPDHDPVQVQRMLDDHVLAYLVWPFSSEELETTIALVMRRFADHQAMKRQAKEYEQGLARLKKLELVRSSLAEAENQSIHSAKTNANANVQALHNRWGQLRSSLERIPHAVQEIDTSGRITFCNDAYCGLHGYSHTDLADMTIWQLLATREEHKVFRKQLEERITRQSPPESYRTRHRHRDGRVIDVQVDWAYMRDHHGDVVGFISIITDVTHQMKDKSLLQEVRRELEWRTEHNKEKLADADQKLREEMVRRQKIEEALRNSKRLASVGVLAAGIAHEINNPIAATLSSAENAQAMHRDGGSHEFVAECLDNIVEAAKRCGKTVKDLLRFASQEPTEKQVYSLNHIVTQANRAVRRVVGDSGMRARCELSDQDCRIIANLLEMEIAVANLVQNALEATLRREATEVVIRTDCTADKVMLIVQDEGSGISEADLEHVFDPFFTTRKETGGTGLGLSIVYAIVQDHGGSIDVTSKLGKGTTFTLVFPKVAKDC